MANSIRVARVAIVGLCGLLGLGGCSAIVGGVLDGKSADAGVAADMLPPGRCATDEQCRNANACDGVERCGDGLCFAGTRAGDGTTCDADFDAETRDLCLAAHCVQSICGDGFTDMPSEACDDGNTTDGDGCDADCTTSCSGPADCDDGDPCTDDRCFEAMRCEHDPLDGPSCGLDGVCQSGLCVPAGCGNGTVDMAVGEQCDPPDGAGCMPNCQWQCEIDAQCEDGDVCNGVSTCDLASHKCQGTSDLVCDDANACTLDSCDALAGCLYAIEDVDGDGHAAMLCGDDCDDADASVHPGAPETCNGIDDDCNGAVDDNPATISWFFDKDGDGYGNPMDAVSSCVPPVGYVANSEDCYDGNSNAHPYRGIVPFFAVERGDSSFDYDCNGTEDRQFGPPMCAVGGRNTCPVGRDSCIGTAGIIDVRSNCGASYTLVSCASCATSLGVCGAVPGATVTQGCN